MKIVIIGGGAAGLMAAALLLGEDNEIILLEKNEKLGKKLFITGKGRCNLTNACDREEFFSNIVSNERFLYSSFDGFNNYDVMGWFEDHGMPIKVERGMRVFPESDKSSDVCKTLEKAVRDNGVCIRLRTEVKDILYEDVELDKFKKKACGVVLSNGEKICADKVIVATGGLSYQTTGSTGDGYKFAKKAGHTVVDCIPSLVALICKEKFYPELAGLSLKNVTLEVFEKSGVMLYSGFGEMLFTHTGISGPLVLSASAESGRRVVDGYATIDFKPALSEEQINERLLKEFAGEPKKQIKSIIRGFLPASLVSIFLHICKIAETKTAAEITKEERQAIISTMKKFRMEISRPADFKEAIITKGGVNVKEINPKTMESKLCKDLYIIGEVLDLDAFTGGFNLQIAWSTAAQAAKGVLNE